MFNDNGANDNNEDMCSRCTSEDNQQQEPREERLFPMNSCQKKSLRVITDEALRQIHIVMTKKKEYAHLLKAFNDILTTYEFPSHAGEALDFAMSCIQKLRNCWVIS